MQKFDKVEIFNKKDIATTFDEYDNFENRKAIIYARNASFDIAKKLGYRYFMQLDDDYSRFEFRLYSQEIYKPSVIRDLDSVILAALDFYKKTNFSSIAFAQGGDFIGGKNNQTAKRPTLFRKCMNTFICSTDRPFQFIGRLNEDVNTYTKKQSVGLLMGTIPFVSIVQGQTQKNAGGMTETYLSSGTYVKSFYSVMGMPSSIHISLMGDKHKRLHHSINWDNTVPKIMSEKMRKI